MDSTLRQRLHDLTLDARRLLMNETAQLLEGVFGLHADGRLEPAEKLPAIQGNPAVAETRARLERLLADEKTAGLAPREAIQKLTKEVAYTWLNRLAAFKMLEARQLIRQSVSRGALSNGFLLWLGEPGHEEEYARYEAGSLPVDALGGDRATRPIAATCWPSALRWRNGFARSSIPPTCRAGSAPVPARWRICWRW